MEQTNRSLQQQCRSEALRAEAASKMLAKHQSEVFNFFLRVYARD